MLDFGRINILDIVDAINEKIYGVSENAGFDDYPYLFLEYSSNGTDEAVDFLGVPLWDSVNSSYEATETVEAFRDYMELRMREVLNATSQIQAMLNKDLQ